MLEAAYRFDAPLSNRLGASLIHAASDGES